MAKLNAGSMIKPMPKAACYHAHSSPQIIENDQSTSMTCGCLRHKMPMESLCMEKQNVQEDRNWRNEESKTMDHCDSEAAWMVEIIESRPTNCCR